jgi:hypothetical protein
MVMALLNMLFPLAFVRSETPAGEFLGKTTVAPSNDAMVQSSSGDFRAKCQTDGNFCIYLVTASGEEKVQFCSNTVFDISSCVFEDDGNFVLFDTAGDPYWSTKDNQVQACSLPPTDYYSPHTLIMQNDGNLCIYNNKYGTDWCTWCSGTAQDGVEKAA